MDIRQGPNRHLQGFFLLVAFILIFPASLLYSQSGETVGDKDINSMKEQVLKKKKEQAEKDKQEKAEQEAKEKKKKQVKNKDEEEEPDAEESENSHTSIFSIFFEIFFKISCAARFADFPYANPDIHGLSTFYFENDPDDEDTNTSEDTSGSDYQNADNSGTTTEPQEKESPPASAVPQKIAVLTLSTYGAYLGDDTWSSTSRCDANLLPIHINALYQATFSTNARFSLFSLNGGFTFFLPFLTLNGFGGMFRLDFMDAPMLGLGFSTQIYLPFNLIIDFYNVNAFVGDMNFSFYSGSLNYAINRFNLGLGVEVNYYDLDYDDYLRWGPYLRLSLWI